MAQATEQSANDRIIYCNGDFVVAEQARISPFDRGFLFGDAIYEVTAVIDGHMIDNDLHLDRLERSLTALGISLPAKREAIAHIQSELIRRNALSEGVIYMQVSRGNADRAFVYPEGLTPNLIMFTQAKNLVDNPAQNHGIAVTLTADERWARRDIKTCMLLSQVLAKQAARQQGYDDAWLVEDGLITEGASATAFIVSADGQLLTRPNSNATLPGCTRKAVLRLCDKHGLRLVERAFSPAEARAATEAFVTSASSFVTPVVRIGETPIADGRPGPMTRRLQSYYLAAARDSEPAALT